MAKTVEIEESQFIGMTETAKTVQAMLANPDARKLLLKAQKTVNPSVVIPEIDAANEVNSEVLKVREEMNAWKKEMADKEAKAAEEAQMNAFRGNWEAQKRQLQQQHGYTAEGIAAIEELAQKEGIASLEAAAALFDRRNPPAAPIDTPGYGGFNFFEPSAAEDSNKYMDKLFASRGEDEAATRAEIAAALNEIRGGTRR